MKKKTLNQLLPVIPVSLNFCLHVSHFSLTVYISMIVARCTAAASMCFPRSVHPSVSYPLFISLQGSVCNVDGPDACVPGVTWWVPTQQLWPLSLQHVFLHLVLLLFLGKHSCTAWSETVIGGIGPDDIMFNLTHNGVRATPWGFAKGCYWSILIYFKSAMLGLHLSLKSLICNWILWGFSPRRVQFLTISETGMVYRWHYGC